MDRTEQFYEAVYACCRRQNHTEAKILELKGRVLLKPTRKSTPFISFSQQVAESIQQLKTFIQRCMHEYVSSGSLTDADRDRIESEVGVFVKTCNEHIDKLKTSVQAACTSGGQHVNPHAAAHLHGVVLILAERLHAVSAVFDKLRAARYSTMADRDSRRRLKPMATPPPLEKPYETRPSPPLPSTFVDGSSAPSDHPAATGQLLSTTITTSYDTSLAAQLERNHQQVLQIERSMREVATLNQMISTAVLHQAEQIEHIYNAAVDATLNFTRGNVEVTKTIEINRSTRKYIFVLLLVATLCLLFYDWMNS